MVILHVNIYSEFGSLSIGWIQVSNCRLKIHVVIRMVCHILRDEHIAPGAACNRRPPDVSYDGFR